ncbi:MAG: methyl-accepting chemotaxis protein [Alphaproteobacteria bacterium]|nr:methyl-accepting chemotaxis protein [Alphaproteobacteria bacterium]
MSSSFSTSTNGKNGLSIKRKASITFICLAVLTAAVGLTGIQGLFGVKSAGDMIYETYLTRAVSISKAESTLRELFSAQKVLMGMQYDENLDGQLETLNNIQSRLNENISRYEGSLGENKESATQLKELAEGLAQANSVIADQIKNNQGYKNVKYARENFEPRMAQMISIFSDIQAENGVGAAAAYDGNNAQYAITLSILGTALLIAILLVLLSWVFVNKNISSAIARMTAKMQELAAGKLDIDVEEISRGDEIGAMAQAVLVFRDSMSNNLKLSADAEMNAKRTEERTKKLQALAVEFDRGVSDLLNNLGQASEKLNATAGNMNTATVTMNDGVDGVSRVTSEASDSVSIVAAAATELAASISEIGSQASHSANKATEAVQEAENANELVQGLASATTKIGEVLTLISDIAEQTNLLALNATIEAARAGDAGKGFAVVASEVKNLATQTAGATDEIGSQITDIQQAMEKTVQGIQGVLSTINEINENTATIAAAVEEQGSATNEIARSTDNASESTKSMSVLLGQVSNAAGSTSTASGEVLSAASELQNNTQGLRDFVNKFLAEMKSA